MSLTLARAIASRYRADLASARIGDGYHFFVIPIPPALLDGAEHLLEIIEQGSGIRLTSEPLPWRAEPAADAQVIEGIGAGTGMSGFLGALSSPRLALAQERLS